MEEAHAAQGAAAEAPEVHHGSVWPLVVAVGVGLTFGGLSTALYLLMIAGLAVLAVGVGGWLWQDAHGPSFRVPGVFEDRPFVGVSVRKMGMWVFIISEIFFFSGLIAAGLGLRVSVPACPAGGASTYACWPQPTSSPLNIQLTAVNTFILITSSLTMVEALHSAQQGNATRMRAFLLATLLLGVTFVSIQVVEYLRLLAENLTPWVNASKPWLGTFGTAFYTQTGFHGAHVAVGLIALAYLNVKAWRGKYGKDNHEAIELVGLYWHFVDIVWIFLFPLMYLIGR